MFKTIRNFGRLTVKKLLYSSDKERDAVAVSLSKLHAEIEDKEEIKFFSETEVQERVDTLFLKGIKNFTLQQYKEAAKKFVESISLNRDNMLYYWNLARVLETEGDLPQALENYKNTKILLKSLRHKNKNKIRQTLTKDLTSCYSSLKGITAPSIPKKPISSLSPI